jgi:hypothetical protein
LIRVGPSAIMLIIISSAIMLIIVSMAHPQPMLPQHM